MAITISTINTRIYLIVMLIVNTYQQVVLQLDLDKKTCIVILSEKLLDLILKLIYNCMKYQNLLLLIKIKK